VRESERERNKKLIKEKYKGVSLVVRVEEIQDARAEGRGGIATNLLTNAYLSCLSSFFALVLVPQSPFHIHNRFFALEGTACCQPGRSGYIGDFLDAALFVGFLLPLIIEI
jgi:hypothetical protein